MHIGILVTNTDESEFAQQHPKDGDKFRSLLSPLRPDWAFSVFSVKDDVFPDDVSRFDGFIITGSPASVNDSADWITKLMHLIQDAHSKTLPMYGACFGHQAIAQALGGVVGKNPTDWIFGRVETTLTQPWDKTQSSLSLYAAHSEQVTTLPTDAVCTGVTADCTNASFAIGKHIWTTQYHPEMTHDFVTALVEEYEDELPANVVTTAKQSLKQPANRDAIASAIIAFFEHAKS